MRVVGENKQGAIKYGYFFLKKTNQWIHILELDTGDGQGIRFVQLKIKNKKIDPGILEEAIRHFGGEVIESEIDEGKTIDPGVAAQPA